MVNRSGRLKWYDLLWAACIAAFFFICLELFRRMIIQYRGMYDSDMPFYAIKVFEARAKSDRLIETISHFLYRTSGGTTGFNIYLAAVIAAIIVANFIVISFYIRRDGLQDRVPRYAAEAASILVLFTGPIYSPHYHRFYYKGSFAGFSWHNPTQQSMLLFSLITVLFLLRMIMEYEKRMPWKWWFATAFAAFLSAAAKPSFVIDLVPSLVVLFLAELLRKSGEEGPALKTRFIRLVAMGCSLIPASIYILILNSLEFGDDTLNGGAYHMIYGLKVFRQKSDVMTMFVFGMAFAIVVVLTNLRRFRDSKYMLTLLLFAAGFLQWALIAEVGERARHGNFAWGRECGVYFLTLACMIILIENIFATDWKDADRKALRLASVSAACIVLLISLLSQFRYFWLIWNGQSFYQ